MGDGSPPDDGSSPDEPSPDDPSPEGDASGSEYGGLGVLDQLLVGLAIAGILAGAIFALSGVWPPLVAVESPSMEPNLYRGDLVFVAEEHRYGSPAAVHGTGVVPARVGEEVGHSSFGAPGDVIVYEPGGRDRSTPIIHRAEFWVNDSENWYEKADPAHLQGENCEAVPNCPAPHAGFVTKGDSNGLYDQVGEVSEPVRPSWVLGKAEYKVPFLGRVRLAFGRLGPGVGFDTPSSGTAVAHAGRASTNATSTGPCCSTGT